jgi:hypothetical protein
LFTYLLGRRDLLGYGLCAGVRIGEQITDQGLHAHRAGGCVLDVSAGVLIKRFPIFPGKHAHIARHHAQRLLQIVTGDRGELCEIRIRTLEFKGLGLRLQGARLELGGAFLYARFEFLLQAADLGLGLAPSRPSSSAPAPDPESIPGTSDR